VCPECWKRRKLRAMKKPYTHPAPEYGDAPGTMHSIVSGEKGFVASGRVPRLPTPGMGHPKIENEFSS
jgi:hypothetical protein